MSNKYVSKLINFLMRKNGKVPYTKPSNQEKIAKLEQEKHNLFLENINHIRKYGVSLKSKAAYFNNNNQIEKAINGLKNQKNIQYLFNKESKTLTIICHLNDL